MRVRILISYKDSVLDPQGQTVLNALHTLGYESVRNVRQGKVFEIEFEGAGREDLERIVPDMAHRVLANTIIEKFSWEFVEP